MQNQEPVTAEFENSSYIEKINHLKALEASQGWLLVLENMRVNKNHIEECLLSMQDPDTGKTLEPQEALNLRDKRLLIIDMMNTPLELIKLLRQAESDSEEDNDLDPYYSDASEMRKQKDT